MEITMLRIRAARLAAVLALSAALSLPSDSARAELAHQGGGWLMFLGQGDFKAASPKLSKVVWWLDVHARFFDDTAGYGQSIVRPAIGWRFNDAITTHIGYGWIRDSPASGPDRDEHRLFQQLIWKHAFGSIAFQSRSRLEQRWVETGSDVGWRFRQFFKLTWPIPGLERLALAGYDELFFAFNDTDWGARAGFDQNRLFVGPQWRFDSEGRIKGEIGYLNRYAQRRGRNDRMDHLVSVNLLTKF